MKKHAYLLIVIAAALLMAGCSGSEDATATLDDGRLPILLQGTFGLEETTRAGADIQGDVFMPNSPISVYIEENVAQGQTKTAYPNPMAFNVQGTAASLVPADGNYPFYPVSGNSVTVRAVYPASHTTSSAFTVQIDQTTQASYLASDLIYGTVTASPTTSAVSMPFRHMMSKVVVNLLAADENVDLTNAVVYFKGAKPTQTFTASTGKVGNVTGNTTDILATNNGSEPFAIVIPPQTLQRGTQVLQITLRTGDVLKCNLGEILTLEQGKVYTFTVNVTVDRTPATIAINEAYLTEVTDWDHVNDASNVPTLETELEPEED